MEYVYGDAEVARRSLSVMDAYGGDVNGIVTYSMWTIVSHDIYQLYFGDAQFLRDRWWRIKACLEDLMSRTDEAVFGRQANVYAVVFEVADDRLDAVKVGK